MGHLYLHVPFCRRRCSYCDFSIAVRKRIPAREYVDAVVQELRRVLTDPGRKPGESGSQALETIYLGGGTPSLLPPDAIAALLTTLRDVFRATSLRDDVEVTLEANLHRSIRIQLCGVHDRAADRFHSIARRCAVDMILTRPMASLAIDPFR